MKSLRSGNGREGEEERESEGVREKGRVTATSRKRHCLRSEGVWEVERGFEYVVSQN
jgi:hypothetical protein